MRSDRATVQLPEQRTLGRLAFQKVAEKWPSRPAIDRIKYIVSRLY
jgi:hypothetical protein